MQFKTQQDVAASIEQVFAACADFPSLERQALRRGIEVERTGGENDPAAAAWSFTFAFRGKPRTVNARVLRHEPPNGYEIDGRTDGLDIHLKVELIALSKTRTRMIVVFNLKPRTMTARLLVQSLKLAKGNINQRFSARIASFAHGVEQGAGA